MTPRLGASRCIFCASPYRLHLRSTPRLAVGMRYSAIAVVTVVTVTAAAMLLIHSPEAMAKPRDGIAMRPQAPTPPRLPPPALMVPTSKDGDERTRPLRITDVKVKATIVGHLAETTMTLTFYNASSRVMEGDLYMPLPEGASISGYALDVQGTLVDGVVVRKDKARQVFEAEVRKGVDPGLVEWTRGNHFKTRVFPIPARGSRTVRVSYVSEVLASRDGARYVLPLNFRDKVASFTLAVEVVKAAGKPLVVAGGPRGLGFSAARDSYMADAELRNVALSRDLIIRLPNIDKRPIRVEQAPDGETYFAIRQRIPRAVIDKVRGQGRTAKDRLQPRRIAVYWDASLSRSRSPEALERELAVLQAYLESLGNTAAEISLVFVRIEAVPGRRFRLPEEREDVIAALRTVDYDGGTQLAALGSRIRDADLNLVFSDGLSTIGDEMPRRLRVPTYVINGATAANHAFLRYLAMSTGGTYFNLGRVDTATAVAGIGGRAFSFLRAEARGAEVDHLYPRLPVPVHGVFDMAGKMNAAQAEIVLHYGIGNQVLHSERVLVKRSDASRGDMVRRYWAQKKVDDLMVFAERNQEALTEVGRRHGIVTPGTSLLVLERLDQYVEYEVRPPASLPAMRAEYDKTMRGRLQIARDAQAEKLTQVIQMWREHKAWWGKRYKYPKNFRYRSKSDKKASGAAMGARRGRVRVSEAEAAPAAPRAPEPDRMMADEDDVGIGGGGAENEGTLARAIGQGRASAKAKKDAGGGQRRPEPAVVLKPWSPDTPYLKVLGRTAKHRQFAEYVRQREQYATSPSFYLDTADFFRERGDLRLALQVLSNLAELELENPALLRVLGHRLAQLDYLDLSIKAFEQVRELRPEEPQSYRDLALVLERRADRGSGDKARADYERALALLAQVVMGEWSRFDRIEVIALIELNAIYAKARRLGPVKAPVDKRLIELRDMDIRIVMTWDADMTDMDLHVVEPSGEEAYYSHNRTTIGGMVSRDFTQGYGPEVYAVRRAMRGDYTIKTKFFGSSAAKLIGAVTLQVDIFTNYGRPNQKRKSLTLRLTEAKETFTVGNIAF